MTKHITSLAQVIKILYSTETKDKVKSEFNCLPYIQHRQLRCQNANCRRRLFEQQTITVDSPLTVWLRVQARSYFQEQVQATASLFLAV